MRHVTVRPGPFIAVLGLIASAVMLAPATSSAATNSGEGCMDQWLFNGVWRVRVTAVEPFMNGTQQAGWQVTEVWRNGTFQPLYPSQSYLDDEVLQLSNGSVKAKDSTSGSLSLGNVANDGFAPAGQFTYKQIFLVPNADPNDKPKALDILFDANKLAMDKGRPQFTSGKYNFHFDLGCVATGAAAQAQGGSTEIPATRGCMNQWMSNGVWKMRVTGIEPNSPTGAFAWFVTQDWVNATSRPIFPGGLAVPPAVPTNVTDEYLVTQSGNNGSSANAVGGFQVGSRNVAFPPEGSFTFKQLFAWSPFDVADKPVRLLVTFDAKTQNAMAGWPHYKMPADFRIDLTCTKP